MPHDKELTRSCLAIGALAGLMLVAVQAVGIDIFGLEAVMDMPSTTATTEDFKRVFAAN